MPAIKVWHEPTNEWIMVGGTGPTGPAGPEGPPGDDGAPGPAGPAGATLHSALSDVTTDQHHAKVHAIDSADHTGVLTDGQIPASIARDSEVTAAVSAHAAAVDPHTGYATDADLTAHAATSHGGSPDWAEDADITTASFGDAPLAAAGTEAAPAGHRHGMPANPITAHLAAGDPHSQYATDTDLTTHAGAADPHPGYLTPAEGAAAYEPTGAVSGHAAAGDPHTGYRLESADHSHATTGLQAGQVAHSALSGVTADQHHAQAHAISGADHTGTLTDAQIPATIARDSEVTAAVTAHEALANPHSTYATDADLTAHAATSHGGSIDWAEDADVTTQAFGDAAAANAGTEAAPAGHRHGMPADPVKPLLMTEQALTLSGANELVTLGATTGVLNVIGGGFSIGGMTGGVTGRVVLLRMSGVGSLLGEEATQTGANRFQAPGGSAGAWDCPPYALIPLVYSGGRWIITGAPWQPTPSTQTFGDAAAGGAAENWARGDHKHAMPANPVTAHEAAGDPHTVYRLESADHSHASSGAQAGQVAHSALSGVGATDHHAAPVAGPDANVTIDAAGAAGTAGAFARSGHGHQLVTHATAAAAIGTASAGTATTAPSRGNHVHPTGAGTPSTQAFGDAAATGAGPAAAMTDHKHAMPANPVSATPPKRTVYSSAAGTSGTWTKTGSPKYIEVVVIGGGGGSGGGASTGSGASAVSGGGGGGGFCTAMFDAAALGSVAYAAGAAGAAGSAGANNGFAGGNSHWGTTVLTAAGGGLGTGAASTSSNSTANGGAGGTAGGTEASKIAIPGGDGGNGESITGIRVYSGTGGGSPYGPMQTPGNGAGRFGNGYGGGAGGAANGGNASAVAGGAGAPGAVIVTEYY